ncbi:MAG: DUF3578 domain-containing protein [Dehalococcoidia bacterium]|nr:DUF3578 domain-containing protein [Dehalococcoidia bacterium]
MTVLGSGGKGTATFTPWIGILDPDETEGPNHGIYPVYIWSQDLQLIALSLNQGIQALQKIHGYAGARSRLRDDADAIHAELPAELLVNFSDPLDLRSEGQRQLSYAAGNICCKTYDTSALPGNKELLDDLRLMLSLYALSIEAKQQLLIERPGVISTPGSPEGPKTDDFFANFKPKDDSDYRSQIEGREIVKSRRHESVVNDFAGLVESLGFAVSAPHPQDLVLMRNGEIFLIEAKVLYKGNAVAAVRSAIGQLLWYAHFHHPDMKPNLVALFSEPVGAAAVEFLESIGIAGVWWSEGNWIGSPRAKSAGLVQPAK